MTDEAREKISDYAMRRYENLLGLNLQVTTDYLEAYRLDVSQLRSLITQISVIAFGILGFSAPLVGGSNTIIKTPGLFVIGSFLVGLSAICGLWYLNIKLQESIINGQKGWTKNKGEIREALENERFLIKNPEKYEEYENRRQKLENQLNTESVSEKKMDNFLHALMLFLSLGICLLFLSVFSITIKI